jgi:hypothetical protein
MNMKSKSEKTVGATTAGTFRNACRACGQKVLAEITRAKDAIFRESRRAFANHERLLRLALNEAEALAWQTMYPHLVFPDLAMEKVREITTWNTRQMRVRRNKVSIIA